jgi:hypothetical protein
MQSSALIINQMLTFWDDKEWLDTGLSVLSLFFSITGGRGLQPVTDAAARRRCSR